MKREIIMSDKTLHIRMFELAEEKGISKTKLCKDLDMQFGNFNKYYNDKFQRIDANLIIKLCEYFQCGISDLLEIRSNDNSNDMTPVRSKQNK